MTASLGSDVKTVALSSMPPRILASSISTDIAVKIGLNMFSELLRAVVISHLSWNLFRTATHCALVEKK